MPFPSIPLKWFFNSSEITRDAQDTGPQHTLIFTYIHTHTRTHTQTLSFTYTGRNLMQMYAYKLYSITYVYLYTCMCLYFNTSHHFVRSMFLLLWKTPAPDWARTGLGFGIGIVCSLPSSQATTMSSSSWYDTSRSSLRVLVFFYVAKFKTLTTGTQFMSSFSWLHALFPNSFTICIKKLWFAHSYLPFMLLIQFINSQDRYWH